MTSRAELVAFAQASIARGSKSFGAASGLFDRTTREWAWLLYAWCRAADDIADGQDMGHGMRAVEDGEARLATIRTLTDAALAGNQTGNPAFDALGLVAAECRLPRRYVDDLVAGFALDAAGFRPQSEAELLQYCYHVAGAVGCMMAIVMGVDPADEAVLDRACDLGIAFQLANIARDLAEDEAAGRCYVPADWAGCSRAEIAAGLAARAEAHEASARYGARFLSFRCAWAVLAAAGIYGDIAREVRRRGAAAWDRRVTTSRAAKLGWLVRSLGAAAMRSRFVDPGREGLFQRPAR